MLNKTDLRDVTFSDLQALKDNQVEESHTLDYKRDFPNDPQARVKLAEDVVAFANTRGGDLILGADEEGGVISQFFPFALADTDAALRSLQSALVDLIEPKVPGVHLQAVQAPEGGYAVVIRVPASFQTPHRVRKTGGFYTRTSTGIDPMDITTLRSAFLRSATAAEQAASFRADRVQHLRIRPLPAPLLPGTIAVLHVVPLSAMLSPASFGMDELRAIAQNTRPPISDGWGPRVNLDGVMSYCGGKETLSYTQFFRNGIIESVMPVEAPGDPVAWVNEFEHVLVDGHHAALVVAWESLGLDGGAFLMLSFAEIGGKLLENPGGRTAFTSGTAAKVPEYYGNLLLPELYCESFRSSKADIYGPLFDMVWNAAGRTQGPRRR
ncbi:AlbA family DNA-binding domain-containing protein [Paraburkholderia sp. CI3]|uniref:AlbA family DNA-binding domain-containing protein n=1 Tax=Paraburkholderia sp. CI3 TaxID=2991060 RepID=UPI003D1FF3FD